jgi:ketosteroid isomerase-like protein
MKAIAIFLAAGFVLSSCSQKPAPPDLKAEGEKVMETSRAWAKSTSNEEYLSYWHKDAFVKSPGQPPIRGHEEISKMLEEGNKIPGFAVDWEPQEVVVSESGDMAYLIENNSFSMSDSTGAPMTFYNKTVTVWKKQEDGSWKCVVDIMSADPSLTAVR